MTLSRGSLGGRTTRVLNHRIRAAPRVTAAGICPLMPERAEASVRAAGMASLVKVTSAVILALPFDEAAFDVVIA